MKTLSTMKVMTIATASVLSLALAAPVLAQKDATAPDNAASVTMQAALGAVQAERGGYIVEAERERERGRLIYEIKGVDSTGARYKLNIDAHTGEQLARHFDD